MKHHFKISRKGYDTYEVDAFIDQMENSLSITNQKLDAYQKQIEHSTHQMMLFKEKYEQLQSQLAIKERAADEISRLALVEANQVIETANTNADIIVNQALTTAKLMLLELNKISEDTKVAKSDLEGRIQQLSKLIDQLELPILPEVNWLQQINSDK